VLVSHADLRVLFDSFYDQDYDRFVLVDKQTESKMIFGEAPFDSIDAIFVSHAHGDHFAAGPIIEHLRNNPKSHLFSTSQVAEALAEQLPQEDPILQRVTGFGLRPGDGVVTHQYNQLEIETVAIPHSGGERMAQMMNLVFRVKLGQTHRVAHFGDASDVIADYTVTGNFFDTRTDTAFVPLWLYASDDGRQILESIINANNTIGIHVPSEAIGSAQQWRDRFNGDLFVEPGETRTIK